MACDDEYRRRAACLANQTWVAADGVIARPKCWRCQQPLNNDDECPQGCAQRVSPRSTFEMARQWFEGAPFEEVAALEREGQPFPTEALEGDRDPVAALSQMRQWYMQASERVPTQLLATQSAVEWPFPLVDVEKALRQGPEEEEQKTYLLVDLGGKLVSTEVFVSSAAACGTALWEMDRTRRSVVPIESSQLSEAKIGKALLDAGKTTYWGNPDSLSACQEALDQTRVALRIARNMDDVELVARALGQQGALETKVAAVLSQAPQDWPARWEWPDLTGPERAVLRQAILDYSWKLAVTPQLEIGPHHYVVEDGTEPKPETDTYVVDLQKQTCTCGEGPAETRCNHVLLATYLHRPRPRWSIDEVRAWREAAMHDGWQARATYAMSNGDEIEPMDRACTLGRDGYTVQIVARPAGETAIDGIPTARDEVHISIWGPEGSQIALTSKEYSFDELEQGMQVCHYCGAEGETQRLGFSLRACAACREVLTEKEEARGWTK